MMTQQSPGDFYYQHLDGGMMEFGVYGSDDYCQMDADGNVIFVPDSASDGFKQFVRECIAKGGAR